MATRRSSPKPRATASSASYYVNADKATTYGRELLAEYRVGESGFMPYASGTLMRHKLDFGSYTTYNSDTPVASGRFGLRYVGRWESLPCWANLFVRAGSGSKQTYQGTAGLVTDKSPSWATLNFAAGANFGPEGVVRWRSRSTTSSTGPIGRHWANCRRSGAASSSRPG